MFRTYGKTKTLFLKITGDRRTKLQNDSPKRHQVLEFQVLEFQVLEFQVFDIGLCCGRIL